jgi:hypothetical protein
MRVPRFFLIPAVSTVVCIIVTATIGRGGR